MIFSGRIQEYLRSTPIHIFSQYYLLACLVTERVVRAMWRRPESRTRTLEHLPSRCGLRPCSDSTNYTNTQVLSTKTRRAKRTLRPFRRYYMFKFLIKYKSENIHQFPCIRDKKEKVLKGDLVVSIDTRNTYLSLCYRHEVPIVIKSI